MNDDRKTKKQLLEEPEQERESSLGLREDSHKVAAARDTEEALGLVMAAKTLWVLTVPPAICRNRCVCV